MEFELDDYRTGKIKKKRRNLSCVNEAQNDYKNNNNDNIDNKEDDNKKNEKTKNNNSNNNTV